MYPIAGPGGPTKLAEASKHVEDLRRIVNRVSSEVPQSLDSDFRTSLDQLADLQYKVSQALAEAAAGGDSTSAEAAAASTVEAAERLVLAVCRAYADIQKDSANQFERDELRKLQANTTDLVLKKQEIDQQFSEAAAAHEANDIRALGPLLKCASEYASWVRTGAATKAGNMAITARERKREKLAFASLIVSLLALLIVLSANWEKVSMFFTHIFKR